MAKSASVSLTNLRFNFHLLLLIIFFLTIYDAVYAQTDSYPQITAKYQQFKFRDVITESSKILKEEHNLNKEERLFLYKYLALSYSHLGDTSAVKSALNKLVNIDPEFTLEYSEASPKLVLMLDKLKSQHKSFGKKPQLIKNIETEKPFFDKGAAIKSLLIPGWGQWIQKKKLRSVVFFSAALAGVSGWIYFNQKTVQAHRDYLNADEYNAIEDKYQTYKDYYQIRNAFIGLTILSWISSHVDAVILNKSPSKNNNLSLSFVSSPESIQIQLKWNRPSIPPGKNSSKQQ